MSYRTCGPAERQIGWFSKHLEIIEAGPSTACKSGHCNSDVPGVIVKEIGLNLIRAGISGLVNL